MNIRALHGTNGELSAFIPDLDPDVTAGERETAREPSAVAGRPDCVPPHDPAGAFLSVLNKAFGRGM